MPKPEKSSLNKKNAYAIRQEISQAVFKEFIVQQCGDTMRGTVFACFNRPLLSSIANLATSAIMKDPRVNVVLKKR